MEPTKPSARIVRAHVRGRVLVPEEDLALPEGMEVVLAVREGAVPAPPPRSTPQAEKLPANLGELILRPQRRLLARVQELVRGAIAGAPADLWQTVLVSGLVPESWQRDNMRRFEPLPRRSYYARGGFTVPARPGSLPHPPTVAACVAFASDPEGVDEAERVMRSEWRFSKGSPLIVWRFSDRQTVGAIRGGYIAALKQGSHPGNGNAHLLATGYALGGFAGDGYVLVCPP